MANSIRVTYEREVGGGFQVWLNAAHCEAIFIGRGDTRADAAADAKKELRDAMRELKEASRGSR